ncbi:hypothetical protein [Rhizobium sp. Rhizsp42]|uniref:hypothetical protein n=1 Tax=Rhizobium sp. Rhizsp42 TaxID=3243034 RepID=UPI0039AFDAFF
MTNINEIMAMPYDRAEFIYRLVNFLPNDKFPAEKADIAAQIFGRTRSCLNIPQIHPAPLPRTTSGRGLTKK